MDMLTTSSWPPFFGQSYAWIAVLVPCALSLLVLLSLRRLSLRLDAALLVGASLLVSWFTRWWSVDADYAGLHIYPAAAMLFLFFWCKHLAAPSLHAAIARGAVIAAFTWVTLFAVDIFGCLVVPTCSLVYTGGAGWTDQLVLGPALAMGGALLCWLAGRVESAIAPPLSHQTPLLESSRAHQDQ